jgi:hypothetical protein
MAPYVNFIDRFCRLLNSFRYNSQKVYAGKERPQEYEPGKWIFAMPKVKKAYWMPSFFGVVFGAVAGHLFKTNVGIEMFFSQPLLVVFAIVNANQMTACICLEIVAGSVCAITFQLYKRTKIRVAQFWWSNVASSIAANAIVCYYFFPTMTA